MYGIRQRVQRVENLVHNEPMFVIKELPNSEGHLPQLTASYYPNDSAGYMPLVFVSELFLNFYLCASGMIVYRHGNDRPLIQLKSEKQ
jgi:hypothetical protein